MTDNKDRFSWSISTSYVKDLMQDNNFDKKVF